MKSRLILARITSEAGDEHWRTHMTAGRHELLGDEPRTLGGGDRALREVRGERA